MENLVKTVVALAAFTLLAIFVGALTTKSYSQMNHEELQRTQQLMINKTQDVIEQLEHSPEKTEFHTKYLRHPSVNWVIAAKKHKDVTNVIITVVHPKINRRIISEGKKENDQFSITFQEPIEYLH